MSYVKQALCAQSYPLLKTQLRHRKLWNICHRLPVGDRKRDQGESYDFVSWCQQRGMEVVAAAGNGRHSKGKSNTRRSTFEDLLADVQPKTEYVWIECVEVL